MNFSMFGHSNNSCKDAVMSAPSVCRAENDCDDYRNFNSAAFTDIAFAVSVLLSAFAVIIKLGVLSVLSILGIIIMLIVICGKHGKQNADFAAAN